MQDRVAIITGATGRLGASVTRRFLDGGIKVAGLYSRESALKDLIERLEPDKTRFRAIKTDVLQDTSVADVVKEVLAVYGHIDVLVNLVGGFLGGVDVEDTTEEQLQKMLGLNFMSVFNCCKHVLPVMHQQSFGRIITIGSKGGLNGTAGIAAYSASKAAVINLTQALAREGRKENITANVVVPSIIDTPENRQAMPESDFNAWVKPADIAETILFLVSEAARDISGAVIPIYGKS